MMTSASTLDLFRERFGDDVRAGVPLARYTSARIGGPSDILVTAKNSDELAAVMSFIWKHGFTCLLLGGGSNVLIGDQGVRGLTVLNRTKAVRFHDGDAPGVWSESGVVLSNLANRCALKGLAGLEWAATVPGTVGGAVYGNAGAFGGDMAGSLIGVEVLTPTGRQHWNVEAMGYGYRTSILKRHDVQAIVLAAELKLRKSTQAEVTAQVAAFSEGRRASQPPGASMGSMFKNPEGDKAGRLIDAAGLKGTRIGNAEISPVHGNFFINHGRARAVDVRKLIELARTTVRAKFGVDLELEVELIGD
jgi:UDP-N-acetylmuramate dehydrogenase